LCHTRLPKVLNLPTAVTLAISTMALPLLGALLLYCSAIGTLGYSTFAAAIPNGGTVKRNGEAWYGVGHVEAGGGPSDKNPFGLDFINAGHTWTIALCGMDSDGDGQSNGLELGDPDCTWSASGGSPSRIVDISHPGFPDSVFTNNTEPAGLADPTGRTEPAGPVLAFGSATDLAMEGRDGASLSLSFRAVGTARDSAEFVVSLDRRAWVGIGVTAGSSLSMDGQGQGSDVVVCTGGEVRRYWITSKSPDLSTYSIVPGSLCQQEGDVTTMNFTRKIAAQGSNHRALLPGSQQQLIFAYGEEGGTTISFHGTGFGGQLIDFATGDTESAQRTVPAVLFVHLVLMAIAWGGILPFGAVVAKTLRSVPGGDAAGWFRLHKRFQCVGWLLQLLGCGAAIWYAQSQGVHFRSTHSWIGIFVVVIGTLQPLNAILRPHKRSLVHTDLTVTRTEEKTKARVIWEVVHKGLGWIAVIIGPLNCVLGIALAHTFGNPSSLVMTAIVLAALCILLPVLFFLFATFRPGNAISKWLLGPAKA